MNDDQIAILVEDTDLHAERLHQLLSEHHPEIRIAARAKNLAEAQSLILSHPRAILFLDIELPDGTIFQLLERIPISEPRLIFTTANMKYAVEAFRWAAVDYLLKPIQREDLAQALARIQDKSLLTEQLQLLAKAYQNQRTKIAISTAEAVHIVKLEQIVRIESSGNYSTIYLASVKKHLVSKTLKEYDQMLSSSGFLRVHQSHLIAVEFIETFVKTDGGYLILKDGSKVPVASRRKGLVLEYLSKLQ